MNKLAVLALAALIALPAYADDQIDIFETIHESSLPFPETTAARDAAFTANMNLPGKIANSIEDAIGPEE